MLRDNIVSHYVYHIVSHYITLYHIVSRCIQRKETIISYLWLYPIVSSCITLCPSVSYCVPLYHNVSHCIIMYHIVSYCNIKYSCLKICAEYLNMLPSSLTPLLVTSLVTLRHTCSETIEFSNPKIYQKRKLLMFCFPRLKEGKLES